MFWPPSSNTNHYCSRNHSIDLWFHGHPSGGALNYCTNCLFWNYILMRPYAGSSKVSRIGCIFASFLSIIQNRGYRVCETLPRRLKYQSLSYAPTYSEPMRVCQSCKRFVKIGVAEGCWESDSWAQAVYLGLLFDRHLSWSRQKHDYQQNLQNHFDY